MTLDDAIAKIDSGEQAFYVQAHRRMVGVIVAVSPSGKKYLKAEADGDQPDSLLDFPNAPRNSRVERGFGVSSHQLSWTSASSGGSAATSR